MFVYWYDEAEVVCVGGLDSIGVSVFELNTSNHGQIAMRHNVVRMLRGFVERVIPLDVKSFYETKRINAKEIRTVKVQNAAKGVE